MKKISLLLFGLTLFIPIFCRQKKALIFGITGQDGTYLAEFLLKKGYQVHGVKRRSSSINTRRIQHLLKETKNNDRLFIHYGELSDTSNIVKLLEEIDPDEIYNLAAQSHVRVSFDMPVYTADVDGLGVLRILEAIRQTGKTEIKFYQASTSEMFGKVHEIPQKETTPFHPRSPYAVSKVYGYWITVNYREAYGIFACNGILFNHESPIREETFVTRKISLAVARHYLGDDEILYLGNLDAKRDWGYAKDYVEAMWLMLQQETPEDYVIATGQTHTVREFAELAYREIGVEICWRGQGVDEEGYDKASGKVLVKIDPQFFRPSEVEFLLGDPSKAKKELGWSSSTEFQNLVKIMVAEDIKLLEKSQDKDYYF